MKGQCTCVTCKTPNLWRCHDANKYVVLFNRFQIFYTKSKFIGRNPANYWETKRVYCLPYVRYSYLSYKMKQIASWLKASPLIPNNKNSYECK